MTIQPRIEALASPLPDSVQRRIDQLIPRGMAAPNLYLTVARNEALFNAMVDMGFIGPTGLFDRRALPARLRELLILRTCVAAANEYEYNLHVQTISARMGVTPQQSAAIKAPTVTGEHWSGAERAAFALVDELVRTCNVTDPTFDAARRHFDEPTLIEITHLVGLYNGVAMMVALARPRLDQYRPA